LFIQQQEEEQWMLLLFIEWRRGRSNHAASGRAKPAAALLVSQDAAVLQPREQMKSAGLHSLSTISCNTALARVYSPANGDNAY